MSLVFSSFPPSSPARRLISQTPFSLSHGIPLKRAAESKGGKQAKCDNLIYPFYQPHVHITIVRTKQSLACERTVPVPGFHLTVIRQLFETASASCAVTVVESAGMITAMIMICIVVLSVYCCLLVMCFF